MLIIANWKMYRSFTQARVWLSEHSQELSILAQNQNLVICPDFCSLPLFKGLSITVGAQDCSEHAQGAYTGQVSAQSLKEAGARYCIVGHGETRHANFTPQILARKVIAALTADLTPIICVGDKLANTAPQEAIAEMFPDLVACAQAIKQSTIPTHRTLIFAYEPLWAIGSGVTASIELVEAITHDLRKFAREHLAHYQTHVIYGGSVTSETLGSLRALTSLDGFLVGKASLDMQELKKIVRLCS